METFTSHEIMHTIRYMMVNELEGMQKKDGAIIDIKYIDGFAKRMINNIKEDRKK